MASVAVIHLKLWVLRNLLTVMKWNLHRIFLQVASTSVTNLLSEKTWYTGVVPIVANFFPQKVDHLPNHFRTKSFGIMGISEQGTPNDGIQRYSVLLALFDKLFRTWGVQTKVLVILRKLYWRTNHSCLKHSIRWSLLLTNRRQSWWGKRLLSAVQASSANCWRWPMKRLTFGVKQCWFNNGH